MSCKLHLNIYIFFKKDLEKFSPKAVMFGAAEPLCSVRREAGDRLAKQKDGENLGSGHVISVLLIMQCSKQMPSSLTTISGGVFCYLQPN